MVMLGVTPSTHKTLRNRIVPVEISRAERRTSPILTVSGAVGEKAIF